MTTKADYRAEEWQLLLDVPTLAGLAVMMAGKSGLSTMKEALAITQATLSGAAEYPDAPLLQAINDARVKGGEKSTAETFSGNPYAGLGREKFLEVVTGKCGEASALLKAKATPTEAEAFRLWTLSIADKVAKAAYEGGFLGFGGTQVSAEEVAAIDKIKSSLIA
jgi:hypothetical protein